MLKTTRLNSNVTSCVRRLCGPAIILVIWFVFTQHKFVNPLFLPPPRPVLVKLLYLFGTLEFFVDICRTLWRALAGLMLCIVTMVPLGLVLGRCKRFYECLEGPIEFFRSLPSSALYPLFVLFFGVGDAAKIAVVFFTCSLLILLNAMYGAQPTPDKEDRVNVMKVLGATRLQMFREVIFRDALPHIAAGIRVALSLSLILVIVTEMFLGTNVGLGRRIYDCYLNYRLPEMYGVIIATGLIGFILNKVFLFIEKRVIFWTKDQL